MSGTSALPSTAVQGVMVHSGTSVQEGPELMPLASAQERPVSSIPAAPDLVSSHSHPSVSPVSVQPASVKLSVPIASAGNPLVSASSLRNLSRRLQTAPQAEPSVRTGTAPLVSPFTQEDLIPVWKAYLQQIEKTQPNYCTILANAAPSVGENYGITLHVANRFVGDELVTGQKPVLDFLRAELKNTGIHFIIRVDETIQPSVKIYSPQEKYEEMLRNNPELRNFKETLNLDIEL